MVDKKYINRRKRRRIIAAIGTSCAAIAIIFGAIALLGQRSAPLTITLSNSGAQLALATSSTEESNKVYLVADKVPSYDEYCEEQLIIYETEEAKTSVDNENVNYKLTPNQQSTLFFKYTFYVVNNGSAAADYDLTLTMSQPTNDATNRYDLDSVLRVRFYENKSEDEHNYVTYAKKSKNYHYDENGEISWKERVSAIEESGYAEEFVNSSIILISNVKNLLPQEKMRYTFVFWIEGDDPQCAGEAPINSALILGVDIGAHESES